MSDRVGGGHKILCYSTSFKIPQDLSVLLLCQASSCTWEQILRLLNSHLLGKISWIILISLDLTSSPYFLVVITMSCQTSGQGLCGSLHGVFLQWYILSYSSLGRGQFWLLLCMMKGSFWLGLLYDRGLIPVCSQGALLVRLDSGRVLFICLCFWSGLEHWKFLNILMCPTACNLFAPSFVTAIVFLGIRLTCSSQNQNCCVEGTPNKMQGGFIRSFIRRFHEWQNQSLVFDILKTLFPLLPPVSGEEN